MKIKTLTLKNFRSYRDVKVDFNDLTAFVGKNDIGKSTLLEALDIFFNDGKGTIKLDKNDINKDALAEGDESISIGVEFTDLPATIILDESADTSFAQEYMLNAQGNLEVIKTYPKAGKAVLAIRANHPKTIKKYDTLLTVKNADLKKLLKDFELTCENEASNPCLRRAIWDAQMPEVGQEERLLELTSTDGKKVAESIMRTFPLYSLFQSDRSNDDSNSEIQDPLKMSVTRLLQDDELKPALDMIAKKILDGLNAVSADTLEKLNELDADMAKTLKPVIPETADLKWADVFKNVSIYGGDDIPINKRGSGVRRMVLLSFFRAQAEKKALDNNGNGLIYAIEEPETSQHSYNQKLLVCSLKIVSQNGSQVILTTHSANIVKGLDFKDVRLVYNGKSGKIVRNIKQDILPTVSLNEVNYLAFNEITPEYHIDLYSFIEANQWKNELESSLPKVPYKRLLPKSGKVVDDPCILPEKVRNMIHHPENKNNGALTMAELCESIDLMREFIQKKLQPGS